MLASVARRRGLWNQSELYFNQAEELDPRNTKIMLEHAFLYDSRPPSFSEAQRKCEQILKITPGDTNTLVELFDIAIAQGDLQRANTLVTRLRPTAADSEAIKRKVDQAILTRRPGKVLPWAE